MRELAARLGINVHDFALFERALTHASLVAESSEVTGDYEALEFLGDAVLGLAIAHRLFELAPDRTPGEYSRLRAGLVNRRCVARVAQALGLAPVIRLGRGEERSGGRERTALLADCLEALIAAVYLDGGWETARALVVRIFDDEIVQALRQERVWDYKSRLQNYCQAEHMPLPRFEVVRSEGPDHRKEFEVEVVLHGQPAGRGHGPTKKEAEQQAARAALEQEGHRFD
ncbi:MAG TPA: ribonuclease III [Candidatus Hydrogenedentes bacterium]|nr:ribonuclease III [Candidatus Hydrogenedentota bacterium]